MPRPLVAGLAFLALLLAAGPAAAGDIRPFVAGSHAAIRAEKAGRPLILSFWSLGCPPCIAEMELWRKVADQHPALAVVLVATDPIEQAPRLLRMLERKGVAGLENWAFADRFAERLRFEVDRRWRGELPRTHLVGADGSVEVVTGLVDETRLAAWLAAQGLGR